VKDIFRKFSNDKALVSDFSDMIYVQIIKDSMLTF
jgi:hypothetical protein